MMELLITSFKVKPVVCTVHLDTSEIELHSIAIHVVPIAKSVVHNKIIVYPVIALNF